MKLDALFFSAHPDDIELCCGGTLAKLIKIGKKAGIIDMTQGELGTRGSSSLRSKESKKAAEVLGVTVRENLKIDDGNLVNTTENRGKVITAIREYTPEVVFAPYFNDRHPDHIHASKLIKEGAFYSGLMKIKSRKNGKIKKSFRPKKIIYYMQTYTFEPSFIIDISNEFETKMKAIKCYSSQFYDPHSKEPQTFISDKKFIEYIESRARFYGFQIGVRFGEPFYIEGSIKLSPEGLFTI
jgi:bacillithiol biosynthesis deacetylase BshB1